MTDERRGFLKTLIGSTVAAAGTVWLPAGIKEKVEEKGVESLTLEEVNAALAALGSRVSDLESRMKAIEDERLEPIRRDLQDPPRMFGTTGSTATFFGF